MKQACQISQYILIMQHYWFEFKVFFQEPFNKSLFIIFGFHTHSCSAYYQSVDGAIVAESEFQSKQFDSDQRVSH